METRQMTPFFSSTFSTLTVLKFHFVFEDSQNHIHVVPRFWLILV